MISWWTFEYTSFKNVKNIFDREEIFSSQDKFPDLEYNMIIYTFNENAFISQNKSLDFELFNMIESLDRIWKISIKQ